jgi:hypothetical protein
MTRSTNTPSHDRNRLANKIREIVPKLADSDDIMRRIAEFKTKKGEQCKSLEELERRDLRNILNATHCHGAL